MKSARGRRLLPRAHAIAACPRCGRAHGGPCKARLARSWVGQAAIEATLRAPDGKCVRVETNLTVEDYGEICRILGAAIRPADADEVLEVEG